MDDSITERLMLPLHKMPIPLEDPLLNLDKKHDLEFAKLKSRHWKINSVCKSERLILPNKIRKSNVSSQINEVTHPFAGVSHQQIVTQNTSIESAKDELAKFMQEPRWLPRQS